MQGGACGPAAVCWTHRKSGPAGDRLSQDPHFSQNPRVLGSTRVSFGWGTNHLGLPRTEGIPGCETQFLTWGRPGGAGQGEERGPALLTQSVGDARLHVVGADVADPVLMLRLRQHHNPNVPERVDGNLAGRTAL